MDCIFCKIVTGELPSQKIWEDENYMAFLDLFPICDGQSLVIPKNHLDSNVFDLDNTQFTNLYLAAKKVVELLNISLQTARCAQVMEGLGVNHAHIKLYPMTAKMIEGGIIHMGEIADEEKLKNIRNLIVSPPSPAVAGFGEANPPSPVDTGYGEAKGGVN